MTNEEYIKRMTTEELAKWLCKHVDCLGCQVRTGCKAANNEECCERFSAWLKETAQEKKE